MIKKNVEERESNKKLITFSRKNLNLVNGLIQDRAAVAGTNYSSVLEEIVLQQFLPESSRKAEYFVRLIYTDGMKDSYMAIMQEISAAISVRASLPNPYRFIEFGMEVVSRPFCSGIDPVHKDLFSEHFYNNCEIIKRKLEAVNKKEISFDDAQYLEDARRLLSLKDPQDFVAYNYYEIVMHYWKELGNSAYVYRLIYDVAALSSPEPWQKPEYRLKAIELIKSEVTSAWDNY